MKTPRLRFTFTSDNKKKLLLFLKYLAASLAVLAVLALTGWLLAGRHALHAYRTVNHLKANLSSLQDAAAGFDFPRVDALLAESRADIEGLSADLHALGWVGYLPGLGDDLDAGREIIGISIDLLDVFTEFWTAVQPLTDQLGALSGEGEVQVEAGSQARDFGAQLLAEMDVLATEVDRMRAEVTLARAKLGR
ncbi:MAG TPA: hypothetical protein PKL83_05080, partial [bacterium]|nr:hypothetical protein [bacterium]